VAVVRLQLLGGFAVRVGDRPVWLPVSSQRVVAFLALHSHPVLRSYVAVNLWPDSTEDRAHASLRTALWRLGRRRTAPIVSTTPRALEIAGSVEVDVRDVAGRARRLVHAKEPPDPHDLGCLCDLGELLVDWYDDWVILERERFHQLHLHALESLCDCCTRDGRFGEAVEAALAAIASEPLRESAHRALIAAYLAEDNAADAMRQYILYRGQAKKRLGIDPSPRMRELVRGLPVE
jgi:DNA-binding SARP family transcriptional activator